MNIFSRFILSGRTALALAGFGLLALLWSPAAQAQGTAPSAANVSAKVDPLAGEAQQEHAAKASKPGEQASQSDSDEGAEKHVYDPKDLLLPSGPRILFDASSNDVLIQDRAGETWYPASLTKLMTAYVVFDRLKKGALRTYQQIPVSGVASAQEPSKIGIPEGKTVSVDFALQALLVYSANDMAYVLAEAVSGTHPRFADDMNRTAQQLGMSASHFINPNGLFDPRHVSSARDMAVLANALIRDFPQYGHYFKQPDLHIGKRRLANRNSLVRTMPEADGMKTGFVCNSGFNLVASATREGRRLVAVVLGANSGGDRARIARAMLEEGFRNAIRPGGVTVNQLPNMPQGAIVPDDMTESVCKTKIPVRLTDGAQLAGWGVSFGAYDTMKKADMALRGRLLSGAGINSRGAEGVVEMPDKTGFAAMLWRLEQGESLRLCAAYRQEGAYCDVMPPALLEQIAAQSRALKPQPADPGIQGSDGGSTKAKSGSKKGSGN